MNHPQSNEQEYINQAIYKSFQELLAKDYSLLEFDVNERTLTHRLAVYLEKYFPNFDVDCEYNRDGEGGDSKRLRNLDFETPGFPNKKIRMDDENATTVFPDIIIHKRGKQIGLVVIEAKKKGVSYEADLRKLHAYKEQLGYKYAYQIIFPTKKENLIEPLNLEELIIQIL